MVGGALSRPLKLFFLIKLLNWVYFPNNKKWKLDRRERIARDKKRSKRERVVLSS